MTRLLLAALVLFSGCSSANWTRADTYRQTVIVALQVVDWGQSRHIANNPEDHFEQNPILGEHPSTGRINTFFVAAIAANALVSYALPRGWREGWQYVSIGYEGNVVLDNHQAGIRW